jgi:amino-acid N-acetyltransferase
VAAPAFVWDAGCKGGRALRATQDACNARRLMGAGMDYAVRRARTSDVRAIRALVDANVGSGRLLDKPTVTLFEDIQEFWVAVTPEGEIAGCGALHVMWDDLAEIRTLAVAGDHQGRGAGNLLVLALLDTARELGVGRVFVLTFAAEFFRKHGFTEIPGQAAAPEVYAELLRSYDEGVAEFLDLDRVKPNTLGNTRMLLRI